MRILVTGGAGYIGSITSAKLIELGHEVIILDNLENGHLSTIEKLKEFDQDLKFIKADLRKKDDVYEKLKDEKIDCVIHFAAYIEVGRSVENPKEFIDNNFGGTKNLLEILDEMNVNKFLFSSTAAVYGHPVKVPITEDSVLSPLNPYGESKLMVEKLLQEYADQGKIDSIRLRYFNPAGSYKTLGEEHNPESHLIPLILKAAKGERDTLYIFGDDYNTTDGTPVRDYIHIEDLAQAHVDALKKLMSHHGSVVYNVGTGEGYTVKEVFELAKRITGKDIPYKIVGKRDGDSEKLVADSQRIQKELGWKNKFEIEDIIKSAWEFEKNR